MDPAGDPIIEVKNLSKRYDAETLAVDSITFSIPKGQICAFLGPNGAGKTTTIKMLTTLLTPTSGTIRIGGFDPVREQDAVRRLFGIVFQDPSLDDELTAYENMEFHGVLYGMGGIPLQKRIEEMMRFVGLWDRQDHLVKTFSGGMKRRLEIARGLLHHPKIFFLDEPTLGLDPQTRRKIWEHIIGLNRNEGVTVFFTTHYIEEAQEMAQCVGVIDRGRIIDHASPEKLMEKTKSKNLEEAYLKLTGSEIRDEEPEKQIKYMHRLYARTR